MYLSKEWYLKWILNEFLHRKLQIIFSYKEKYGKKNRGGENHRPWDSEEINMPVDYILRQNVRTHRGWQGWKEGPFTIQSVLPFKAGLCYPVSFKNILLIHKKRQWGEISVLKKHSSPPQQAILTDTSSWTGGYWFIVKILWVSMVQEFHYHMIAAWTGT